jgi:hypothetical protein
VALSISTDRQLRTPGQLLELVKAVKGAAVEDEAHWIEWKCGPQLAEKEGCAKAARFILAAANRPNRVADQVVGGCAYLVLGVEPGNVVPTLLPDPAKVDDGLRRFLGTDGPLYGAQILDIAGSPVVVITVEPTTPDQRPFIARGNFSSSSQIIRDGAIYIRRNGLAQEADSAELAELLEAKQRALVRGGPDWALRVEANSNGELMPIAYDHESIESWLQSERTELMSPQAIDLPTALSFLDSGQSNDWAARIDRYMEMARPRIIATLLHRLSSAGMSTVSAAAFNDGDDNLDSLIVEFDLPIGARAIGRWSDIDKADLIPARPVSNLARLGMYDHLSLPTIRPPHSGVSLEMLGDSLRVSLPEREVRPRTGTRLGWFTLLVPQEFAEASVELKWRGHSSDRRGVTEGVVTLGVLRGVASIADALMLQPSLAS